MLTSKTLILIVKFIYKKYFVMWLLILIKKKVLFDLPVKPVFIQRERGKSEAVQ